MPQFWRWYRQLSALIRRRHLERDLDDEVAFHLAMREAEHREAGLGPEDARLTARRQFGNTALLKEQTRDAWIFNSLESWLQDLRFAGRTLSRSPGFTTVVVFTLALAIGITTAMFTLADALLLRPVPFRAPAELAFIYMGDEHGGRTTVAPSVLRAWRESPAFAGAESAVAGTALVQLDGTVVMRSIARVTPGVFDLLGGVRPIRGRMFNMSEGRAGDDERILISEDLWRELYGADPALVGRRITVATQSLLVVGILPADFRFPKWDTVIWRAVDFAAPSTAVANFPMVYVRFANNIPRNDALRLAEDAARSADVRNAKLRPRVSPLAGEVLDPYYQRAVPLLAGGVLLVFLVLCANVASLLMARFTERRREFSVRSALGAARGRVVRQAFVESAITGALGIVAGIGLAWALISIARAFLPEALLLRTLNPLNLDVRAVSVAAVAGVFAVFAAGLLPAWIGTGVDPVHSLRISERGGTETRGTRSVTRGLLIAEIALACTLLVGATLLVRSFMNLSTTDRGLDTNGVLTAWITLPRAAARDQSARTLAVLSLEDQLKRLPGVQQVVWSSGLPPNRSIFSWGDWKSDVPGAPAMNLEVNRYRVGPDYFAFYGVPLLRGRGFQPFDGPGAVIVGERFARALWPNIDPIGRTFTFDNEHFQVIGVAREIRHPSLDPRMDPPEFYERFAATGGSAFVSIRCGSICPSVAAVRQRILATQPDVTIVDANRLDDVYFEQLAQPRATGALAAAFAAIALLAAGAGLFSVLSYAVVRRNREFGIRTALGATAGQLQRLVLRDGMVVAVTGAGIGALAGWLLARAMSSLQYGVTISDPLSWGIVLGLLGLTSISASWLPARAATRVDPVLLLKDE